MFKLLFCHWILFVKLTVNSFLLLKEPALRWFRFKYFETPANATLFKNIIRVSVLHFCFPICPELLYYDFLLSLLIKNFKCRLNKCLNLMTLLGICTILSNSWTFSWNWTTRAWKVSRLDHHSSQFAKGAEGFFFIWNTSSMIVFVSLLVKYLVILT